ncbi:replication initiation protein [Riemerella anatipestifer]|uniref:replication initiation protein n=1 Tax=Riemerella anatipestifer TaxID=34085 RepID=UPI00129E697A|nr:replication initiation protein [Riemerella anatipestifer]MBT0550787.1 hypothetical protein [Riemerella anatipestifer]MBT0553509.1 hypothetical protein [Riemerella anatipestifer]MCE3024316.1 replication initiation protein [Riemerella anatipestifer]MCU7541934.1 replication initiation protein [Riemerella anatipestifer]MCU7559047.1 replication initiation protein [Riemerella anatipestifer]
MEGLNRLDWVKKIYPDFKEAKWMNDNVIRPEEIENYDFYEESNTYEDYIDPSKIIGISYADDYNYYHDITWLQLLNELKKLHLVIGNFKTYDEVIKHIYYSKGDKCVYKYGEYYITTSGQHRLCLAKFLNLEKVKVFITEYKINESRFNYYKLLQENIELLKSLGFYYKTDKELLKQTTIKYLFLKFGKFELVINSDIMPFFIEFYKNLKPNFLYTQYAKLKRNFTSNQPIYIDTIEELKKYKHIIITAKLQ